MPDSHMTLYYIHDPMCSWCWAFRPTWAQIVAAAPSTLTITRILGGLAPDTDQPMPDPMRHKLQTIWRTIQQRVPGTEFNFDFWTDCRPRRATYPACRAVIAAVQQGTAYEEAMILRIQQGYYLQAQNPSEDETLIQFAADIGLDIEQFTAALKAPETQKELLNQIHFGRQIGAQGFPSLILEQNGRYAMIPYDYNDPDVVLRQLAQLPV
ncbi:MAG: DsbA family protein [Anaerolineales bacterium]|nr:DsbA family protein [Anaerolineales bacterium]